MANAKKSAPSGKAARKRKKPVQYVSSADSSVVNDNTVAYAGKRQTQLTSATLMESAILLKEVTDKPENQMTSLEKMRIARAGVRKRDLEDFKEKTALDYDDLANVLAVTRATLINKKGEEKFNVSLSERIVDLAGLYSYGYEVFEDIDRFNEWIFRPNRALGGQAPLEYIDNQFGREEVRNIIGRIDYGVYS